MNTYSVPISAKGIVFEGGAVWLRKNERNEWELPGGKVHEGEQPTTLPMQQFYKDAIRVCGKI